MTEQTLRAKIDTLWMKYMPNRPNVFESKFLDAILALLVERVTAEGKKWENHTDKFGVGVHAGIEAVEYILKEEA